MKSLKPLESKEFACEADILSAAADFEKTFKYHLLSELEVVSKPYYPTLRWTLQFFQSVHLVFVDRIKSSIKLTNRQNLILKFLGSSCHQYYFLS